LKTACYAENQPVSLLIITLAVAKTFTKNLPKASDSVIFSSSSSSSPKSTMGVKAYLETEEFKCDNVRSVGNQKIHLVVHRDLRTRKLLRPGPKETKRRPYRAEKHLLTRGV